MFSAEAENVLMPFLLNVLNGTDSEISINPTKILSASSSGAMNSFDASKPSNENLVGVIQVHHPIFKYDQNCGPKGTQTIMNILESWKSDDNIVAVVMDYNSGGGQVSGTREIAKYIFDYPKAIVSYSNDTVGSAAYYMYAAGKYKMINQYADYIGCIGTMFKTVDLSGVIEKAGGKIIEEYSDLSPKKNLQSRQIKEGNFRPVIEKFLNPDAKQFHDDMKEFVPGITDEALMGDIYSPIDALAEGLVDGLGTLQEAINKAFELSKATKTNNLNTNTNMNTQSLPKVEAVLGLNAPLASNENGSFLNEEQLGTIEAHLNVLESENSTIQTQLEDAKTANTATVEALQTQVTDATANTTAIETSVNAILTNAGLTVEGSLSEKLNAINTKAEAFGKSDGSQHSKPIIDATQKTAPDYVNNEAAHNQIANSLK
jgi:protease-4